MVLLVLRQSTGTPKLLPSLVNPLVANWRRKGEREGGEGRRKGEREGGRKEREGGEGGKGGEGEREGWRWRTLQFLTLKWRGVFRQ